MSTIRIVIADDQILMRDALQTVINLEEDLQVVGVADNGEQALDLVRSLQPDLVLMDVQMPRMDGIEAVKIILSETPGTKVLMLTTFADDDYIVDSMSLGAAGFLLKDMPADKLIQSIRDAFAGQLILPGIVAGKLAAQLSMWGGTQKKPPQAGRLRREGISFTSKEKMVIQLLLEGRTNKEIAKKLYMSEGTVKNYVSIVYHKIGTNDRTKAIMLLKELGIQG
ncbi:response regulator transcription factor [Cohnella candidum]|uniref:DNA-binding response regulator n=1 Tax=Cohnella candidum TaxID=2674991 RepID=A0A3G3JYT0_9BACL|nr:response regulator transcription factor [Cohnella candidum]AYQ73353.1 DNA-binding response regulator [Cohnella candidum]